MMFRGMILAAVALAFSGALTACASPPNLRKQPDATPPVLGAFRGDPPVTTPADWARRTPLLREALQDAVYGHPPELGAATVEAREPLILPGTDGMVMEQWTVKLGDGGGRRRFHMLVASPKGVTGAPVIVMELFCSPRSAVEGRPASIFEDTAALPGPCRSHNLDPILTVILGKRISGPDFALLARRGYAVALFYPGEVVPDDPALAPPALAALQPGFPADKRAGALAVWADLFSKAYDVLSVDERFDPKKIVAWGHSRHGKAALLAGALDPRLAAVIAHQSGRGGASLSRSIAGESVAQITQSYGFWFTPTYAKGAPADLDQHQLIALNAPRPVLLGTGAADTWSDPAGAFKAAKGADPAYRLLGAPGFNAEDLHDFRPADGVVWWSRPLGHGVTTADWRGFLEFLDAHVK
jgi:dienelactone hydrolase